MTDNLLAQAAHGSREAQAALVDVIVSADTPLRTRQIEALIGAELFARMAAQHGELEDLRRLAGVLMMRASYEREHGCVTLAASLDAEALSLLEMGADDGDELAGELLNNAADKLPAAPFAMLKIMKENRT